MSKSKFHDLDNVSRQKLDLAVNLLGHWSRAVSIGYITEEKTLKKALAVIENLAELELNPTKDKDGYNIGV